MRKVLAWLLVVVLLASASFAVSAWQLTERSAGGADEKSSVFQIDPLDTLEFFITAHQRISRLLAGIPYAD